MKKIITLLVLTCLMSCGGGSSSSDHANTSAAPDTAAPTAPGSLSAQAASATAVNLTWTASTDNVGVTKYQVFRLGSSSVLAETTATNYSDTTVVGDTDYSYQVKAIDAANNASGMSNTATVKTPMGQDVVAPTAPAGLNAQATSTTSVKLVWDASTDNVGVAKYQIFRTDSPDMLAETTLTTYSDISVVGNSSYSYKVRALDVANNASGFSNTAAAKTPFISNTVAPTVPSGLSAQAVSSTRVDLTWAASTNVAVAKYQILRAGSAGVLAETTATTYSDTSVVGDTNYSYQVRALDASNNASGFSGSATVKTPAPPDSVAPTAPTGLSAQAASATQVNLSWTASTDNVGVARYQVFRVGSAGVLAETTLTNFSDTTVVGNTSYSYQVKALDAANNASALSNTATIKTPVAPDTIAPTAPTALSAQAASATRINLAWTASTDNVGVTKYQVFRVGSAGVLAETTLANYSDSTVVGDTSYSYQVKALDAANNASDFSNVATIKTPAAPDTVAPSTPTGLGAQASSATQVNLTWTASTDNVGVTKYQVFRVGTSGVLAETTAASYSDLTVVGNTNYSYQVKALDAANNASALSSTATIKTPAVADTTAPTTPTGLSALAPSATSVNLTWTASTDNVGVTKYQVFRVGTSGVLAETTVTNYSDTTVVGNTNYSYQVKALDAANNASTLSSTATVKTPAVADTTAPTAPTGLSAQAISLTQVNLTWTASSDNVGVTKYQVFRVGTSGVLAETTATNYSDATVVGSTNYSYQVKALDAANNASALSNTASVTTPTIPTITTQPASLTVNPGQSASFTVVAAGTAPFWYHWYKNGSLITACTTNVCTVASAAAADAGSYAVEVGNDFGHLSSATAVLTVTSGVVVTAASCMPNDVQAALNNAPAGATVAVPAGTCDWGSAPTVKRAAGVWLKGAGKTATIIQRTGAVQILHPNDNPPNTYFMMEFDCANGQKVEVSDMTFLGNDDLQDEATRLYDNDGGLSLINGCTNFKIHDAKFNKFSNAGLSIRGTATKGVVYSSEFTGNFKCQPNPVSCLGYGVVVMGDDAWPALSLGSANAVFIEDNVFSDNRHSVASNYGSQYVVRHNTITASERARNFGMLDAHGLTSKHGSRSWEIYQNTFADSSTTHQNTTAVDLRGGDGVIWGNTYPSSFHSVVIFSSENSCKDGSGNLKSYPLQDQTTDAWIWGNTISAPTLAMANYYGNNDAACAAYFVLDRDYHMSAKPGYVPYAYPHPSR